MLKNIMKKNNKITNQDWELQLPKEYINDLPFITPEQKKLIKRHNLRILGLNYPDEILNNITTIKLVEGNRIK